MTDLPDINDVGVPVKNGESFLQTYTGKLVSVQKPDPKDLDPLDMIHAISLSCRFNGHCSRLYTVGEHTLNGDFIIRKLAGDFAPLRKSWFIHDLTEAYVGDVIRPVKRHLPEFKDIEKVFHKALCEKFGLQGVFNEEGVHQIDNYVVMWEKEYLLPKEVYWPGMPDISWLKLPQLPQRLVEDTRNQLLDLKRELFPEMNLW